MLVRIRRFLVTGRGRLAVAAIVAVGLGPALLAGAPSALAHAQPPPPPPPKPPVKHEPPACEPTTCAVLAREVCEMLGGCNHRHSLDSLWRQTARNQEGFARAIEAAGVDSRPTSFGWEAHHIVPIGDKYAYVAQAILQRVGIPANAGVNGVFLRGPRLKKGKAAYKRLPASAKRRLYHLDLNGNFNRMYYGEVINRALLGACSVHTGRCSRAAAERILQQLRQAMVAGSPEFLRPGRIRHTVLVP